MKSAKDKIEKYSLYSTNILLFILLSYFFFVFFCFLFFVFVFVCFECFFFCKSCIHFKTNQNSFSCLNVKIIRTYQQITVVYSPNAYSNITTPNQERGTYITSHSRMERRQQADYWAATNILLLEDSTLPPKITQHTRLTQDNYRHQPTR